MFELIGLAAVRATGYGWLWGKRDLPSTSDAFGNGGHLMTIGLAVALIACALIACAVALGVLR